MASGNDNITSSNSDLRVVGSHRPGSIQRVQLKNFLTHGNVEFRPGARFVVVKSGLFLLLITAFYILVLRDAYTSRFFSDFSLHV
jgi:hypothetical protein